jgi:hypothetical protein
MDDQGSGVIGYQKEYNSKKTIQKSLHLKRNFVEDPDPVGSKWKAKI